MRNGNRIQGVIERRGRLNYRVFAENGKSYLVPFRLVNKENQTKISLPTPHFALEKVIPDVLHECQALLANFGIQLPVRYKHNVWSTHFRHNCHIQFGEKCIDYQLSNVYGADNVGANLRRFKISPSASTRVAMLICHEAAHAIAHERYGAHILPHGRQFHEVLQELFVTEFTDIEKRLKIVLECARLTPVQS